jgi:hypothetical protein
MAVRIAFGISESLHDRLRCKAERSGTSMSNLIVHALEQVYKAPEKKEPMTGPLVRGKGRLGPQFPEDENPHDLISS